MLRSDVGFASEGIRLRGWLYRPHDRADNLWPAIVMAHGFSAVKEQYLDRYAEVFASAGFIVLVFDHANFGDSDGLPRQEVDPVRQRRGYRDAISYLNTLPEVDSSRIGIWGSSFSGGHVIEVAAIDRRVRCVVTQVPQTSGYEAALRRTRADLVPAALERFAKDRLGRFQGAAPTMIPAVSDDPSTSCAMPGMDCYTFFTETMPFAPNWRNEVTLRSAEMSRENEPGRFIARISPTPMLMIVADNDLLTATDLALSAYEVAREPKKLVMIPGGHFTPYIEHFELTSGVARDWFTQYLLAP